MYFSKNVVCQGPTVRPIDWEAAGAGAGELDLATVTTGWPARVTTQAEQDYCRARWPDGAERTSLWSSPPPGFTLGSAGWSRALNRERIARKPAPIGYCAQRVNDWGGFPKRRDVRERVMGDAGIEPATFCV